MEKIKLILHDDKFASLSSNEVVYAGDDNEFFYENTNEPVPYGEPVGIDVPVYDFDHLQYEDDENDQSRDRDKWRWYANQEFEALINDWIKPSKIDFILFKNIYWKPLDNK
jgi:hypothetical protein